MNPPLPRSVLLVLWLVLLSGLHIPMSVSSLQAAEYPRVMVILDASGSMWGKAGQATKIEAAREVMHKVIPGIPEEVSVGLTAYGHRRKGDCSDIEILIPVENTNRKELLGRVDALSPKGKTPIAAAVKLVAESIRNSEEETTIILVSDGHETCHDDPCKVIRALKESGIHFVMHVVGFAVNQKQKEQLDCLADATGGRYFGAADTGTLLKALETIRTEVHRKVEKAKTTVSAVSTGLGKLRIAMPRDALECMNTIKIVRVKDGKLVKRIKSTLIADDEHPLPAGQYEVIGGYANSNYKPDSEVSLGMYEIEGGRTTELNMGSLAIDITGELSAMPAGAVIITRKGENAVNLITPETGNTHYFYKTKPLPPGTYDLAVHYKGSYLHKTKDKPVVLHAGAVVKPGLETRVAIDTGIQLKQPQNPDVSSWALVPSGKNTPLIKIEKASNGDYPLWKPYAVPPGTYDLMIYLEGMTEPLAAGKNLSIAKGTLLTFDTGM